MVQESTPDIGASRRLELEQESDEVAQLKAALLQAEDKYRVLVENANDAIFVLQDGKIRFANPKALALGGVLAENWKRCLLPSTSIPKNGRRWCSGTNSA